MNLCPEKKNSQQIEGKKWRKNKENRKVTMNDTFNSSGYIAEVLGPVISLPLSWMFLLTSVYVVIFLMGTIGNILVVIVILKFRFMRENITNLYLCNLAVTDLLSITAGQFFFSFFLYFYNNQNFYYSLNPLSFLKSRFCRRQFLPHVW